MFEELNFNDKRTRDGVKSAIEFLSPFAAKQTHHNSWSFSTRQLDKPLGQPQTKNGKCLRRDLLICAVDEYISSGPNSSTKRYFVNKDALQELKNKLSNYNNNKKVRKTNKYTTFMCITSPDPFLTQALIDELKTGHFKYKTHLTTKRETHLLQRLPKKERNKYLVPAGYIWDYDIESAAPSLLLQYALRVGPDLSEDLYIPHYFPALHNLLNHKNEVRQYLCNILEIKEIVNIKKLLHGILMGGSVRISSPTRVNQLATYLYNDKARIMCCNENQFIIQLKKDFNYLWSQIEMYEGKRYSLVKPDGTKREKPMKMKYSSKRKMSCYLSIEAKVRGEVYDYLNNRNIRYFQMHDGVQTDTQINRDELGLLILNSTGYRVKFSEEKQTNDEEQKS